VWVNGQRVGFHANGYMPFYYDITPYLLPVGQENLIAVRVQNMGDNSRWYSGSGLYRHVWLTVVHPVHVDVWGTFVTTPNVSKKSADVNVNVTLRNVTDQNSSVTLQTKFFDAQGKKITESQDNIFVDASSRKMIDQKLSLNKPQLWSLDSPTLYRAETTILLNNKIVDFYETAFGIRTIEYSAEKGFVLNGVPTLLKGACIHHDNGILGSAAFDRAEERRVEILKANGYNAIRTAHNPPSTQFLDACDRLGVLIINEAFDTWEAAKKPQGMHRFFRYTWQDELTNFIKRDRNHPSVIMWSIGNEIRERATARGLEIGKALVDHVHSLDSTRPATNAICEFWDSRGKSWEDTAPAFSLLDVHGYNYQWERYEEDHANYPERIMVGTESIARDALQNWRLVEKHPYVIGDFVWTGMDYFGESGLGYSVYVDPDVELRHTRPWPWFNAWCGDIDVIGDKKPQSFYRDVVWGESQLEMAVHAPIPDGKKEVVSFWGWPDEEVSWNWDGHEGEPLTVSIYSSLPKIRLELNGQVIGEQSIDLDSSITAVFEVPYEAGQLKAIALKDGKAVAGKILQTTGVPAAIQLAVDRPVIRADRNDLAFISVSIVDDNGRVVPTAEHLIQFDIKGAGEIIAAGNASPHQMASFQQPQCVAFRGRALVVIRPTQQIGQIELTATSDGLTSDSIIFQTH
jgi:beta-galactosidase